MTDRLGPLIAFPRNHAVAQNTFPAPIFNRFRGLFAKTGSVVLMVLITRVGVSSAIRTPKALLSDFFGSTNSAGNAGGFVGHLLIQGVITYGHGS